MEQRFAQFDVRLALEPGKDENNRIAISNKIWAYLQAGLYILATDTPAQVWFMNEHVGHGLICEIDETRRRKNAEENDETRRREDAKINEPVSEAVEKILNNIETIRKEKMERFERAKELSWEKESENLQKIWETIFID